MSILETSQVIFNLIISLTAVLVIVLIGIVAYDVFKVSKSVNELIENLHKESSEFYEKLNRHLENIFSLSFISKFFNKKSKNKKGRSK